MKTTPELTVVEQLAQDPDIPLDLLVTLYLGWKAPLAMTSALFEAARKNIYKLGRL